MTIDDDKPDDEYDFAEKDCPHDNWEYCGDWFGDPEVPGGTQDCSFWTCMDCGKEQVETPDGIDEGFSDGNEDEEPQNRNGNYESDFAFDPFKNEP